MKEYIDLSDCPIRLQESVNRSLEQNVGKTILSVQKWVTTPYKDKTITDTAYKVFLQYGNYFTIHQISVCSKPEWSEADVSISGMIAGEIRELVSLSDMLKP